MVSGFFTRRIMQVQTVGDVLNGRRLALGISLERVAQETQVQAKYLEALEKEDRKHLPAEIYVRGFIRTYARYLRLDEVALLAQWERERGIARHMENKTSVSAPVDGKRAFPDRKPLLPRLKITPLVFRSGLIGLALIAGLVYVTLAVSSLGRKPSLVLIEPSRDHSVTDSALVLVGETDASAELTINGQPVLVSADGNFRETLTLQAGMNQIKIAARSKLGRETEIVRTIQANLDPVAVKNDVRPGDVDSDVIEVIDDESEPQEGPVAVTVEILNEATWISVDVDGRSAFEGTLLPSSTKTFVGDNQVVLTSGKAEHTAVEFRGKKLTKLGEGFLRGITFTEDLDLSDLSTTAARN